MLLNVRPSKNMGKEPLSCPRYRWEDNIKVGFQEIYWWAVWTVLMKLRIETLVLVAVVNAVMNLQVL